jgi:hypothetical protein
MKNDTVQITLTRTQVALVRQILGDAADQNAQLAGKELAKLHGSEEWKELNANWFRKRAHTAQWLKVQLRKASDMRRKYIDLSETVFPMSK